MSAYVLAIRNHPESGPGRYPAWLRAAGLEVEVRPGEDGLPGDLKGINGLIMLGGGLMPDDDAAAPWLAGERTLVARALDEHVPILGICLGGQLLAHVGGGRVRSDHGVIERGATRIRLTPAAAEDGLLGRLPASFYAIENHRDAITELPPGSVHLAYSEDCPNQAFRLGDVAWGLQFHPEASSANVARWNPAKVRADGFDHDELIRLAQSVEPESERACRQIAEAFATAVHQHAAT
ncbi:type 1 glutamine amidotransferase [Pseudactinotalea sp. Z1739]|uniref:type 1 glutamine amidotransferase n=1 Tax=Pseudactinotalea sp. Z1739 TaxID=3413028 RepID=UPI003C7AEA5D